MAGFFIYRFLRYDISPGDSFNCPALSWCQQKSWEKSFEIFIALCYNIFLIKKFIYSIMSSIHE